MYLFIVNPISGNGKGKKVWVEIEKQLQLKNVAYAVHFTKAPVEGCTYVAETLQNDVHHEIKGVIAVGGDGTVHDVLNGLKQSGRDIPFGVIPGGSGNDLARQLNINHPERALEAILSGTVTRMDLGLVNHQYYIINNIGVGFDATVSLTANLAWYKKLLHKLKLGKLVYVFAMLHVLLTYRKLKITIETEHFKKEWTNAWFVAVSNIENYGGGMKICPDAKYDDGQFQAIVVNNLSRIRFVLFFPKVFSGTHKGLRGVDFFDAKRIKITTDRPVHVHMDGEVRFDSPVEIEIQPLAVKAFYHPRSEER